MQSNKNTALLPLLDSPPVQSVTDSLALSQYVDGTIVVVRAGKTTNDDLESGMKKLHDVRTHFLGFVLNGMKSQDMGKYYYAGYRLRLEHQTDSQRPVAYP